MNVEHESDLNNENRQPAGRSSFAEAFYNAGESLEYKYEEPLI